MNKFCFKIHVIMPLAQTSLLLHAQSLHMYTGFHHCLEHIYFAFSYTLGI